MDSELSEVTTQASGNRPSEIDMEAIKRAIQPHVMTKATYYVDRARAETLYQFDEQDAAVAIIAPYAYGEKPEEVEVEIGGDGTP